MKLYKGFDKNLKCRGFQYEVGREYEEDRAELCSSGFHACENPLDVFGYYPPADSRYCEVELEDVSEKISGDSKRCGKKIRIGAEVGIKGIIDAFVKFTLERVDWEHSKEEKGRVYCYRHRHRKQSKGRAWLLHRPRRVETGREL